MGHLQFGLLPLGLSSSPRVFTKAMAEALNSLRLKGIAIVPYLDSLLLFAESKDQVIVNLSSNSEAPKQFRLAPKSSEVESYPCLANGIPRVRDGFDATKNLSPGRKGRKDC